MEIYVNKKYLANSEIKKSLNYVYIEEDLVNKIIELKEDQDTIIQIKKDDIYNSNYKINWNQHSLNYYNQIIKNNRSMFINCDMYEDFLEYKISVIKINNKLYLNSIKHILNYI